MDPLTKTYISLGLVFLALFEFWTAMQVFGKGKPDSRSRLLLRLHRVGGYVFLVYFAWISWVCVNMMGRLTAAGGYHLDVRGFYHGFLAITLFVLLVLKISFVRIYGKFRVHARVIGIILAVGTVVLWLIAGWMFLILMGGAKTTT